jgi:hypothetical protein
MLLVALAAVVLHADAVPPSSTPPTSSPPPQPPVSVYNPGFVGEGMRKDAKTFDTMVFDNELRRIGVKVVDKAEGADATVAITISRLGQGGTQVDLEAKLADGTPIAARNVQAMGDGELKELLRMMARELAHALFIKLNREPQTQPQLDLPPPPPEYTSTTPGLGVAVCGVLVFGGGVAMYVIGKAQLADVHDGRPATWPSALNSAQIAQLLGNVGLAAMIVGAVAAVGGAGYSFVVSRINASLEVTGFLGPNSGGFAFGGHF